ncbi:MAG TPA: Mur ligase [Opitutae bacterium]|nr:Mur ligase [Opitutaceae bacterium]HCR30329.1 Mur ligase [Opitutae bacterium]
MRIYFLGIAGAAMGNAALLLRNLGHEVLGSDKAVYPPMSDKLAEAKIELLEGYDANRLQALSPDLVIVGNAFSRGNEEIEFLLSSKKTSFTSLPEAMNRFVLSNRRNLVVTGTHGKTTTTALAAYLLEKAGANPGYLIGGAPMDPESGWNAGVSEGLFVIEGDEYDSAFFDKRSKFIHYSPTVAVVNNLEFDHADIFRDLEDVKRSFRHFCRIIPGNGHLLINGDDENALSLLPASWTRVYTVGEGEHCDLRIEQYKTTPAGSRFDLSWSGKPWLTVDWGMVGKFNARNAAMACLGAALILDPESDPGSFEAAGIDSFRGVARRQQVKLDTKPLVVVEDFAHHPTAIREILESFRARFPGRKLVAAFEPRSNTSRLEIMRERLGEALSVADTVVIGVARQANSEGVSLLDTEDLASDLQNRGIEANAARSNEDALKVLRERCQSGDDDQTVVFLTNGSFDGIIDRFVEER